MVSARYRCERDRFVGGPPVLPDDRRPPSSELSVFSSRHLGNRVEIFIGQEDNLLVELMGFETLLPQDSVLSGGNAYAAVSLFGAAFTSAPPPQLQALLTMTTAAKHLRKLFQNLNLALTILCRNGHNQMRLIMSFTLCM